MNTVLSDLGIDGLLSFLQKNGVRWGSRLGTYLYRNVELPRVSTEYLSGTSNTLTTLSGWGLPDHRQIMVGMAEIVGSVHPNYYAVALVMSLAGIFVYIKIRYPFWNTQPVLHTYNMFRRIFTRSSHVIQKYPYKTRWHDTNRAIQTLDVTRMTDDDKRAVAEFLQTHYLTTDRLLFTITAPMIGLYLEGPNAPSFVSIHRELDGHITGITTSRLLHIHAARTTLDSSLSVYYSDLFCVHRESEPKRHIAETLFQTHEYNVRIHQPSIPVSLFKKEGDLCDGVVPLLEYTTSSFYLRNLALRPLPPHFQMARVAKQNGDLLHDFYHMFSTSSGSDPGLFEVCLLPEVGHFRSLLVAPNTMYMFCLKAGGHIYGIYVFRNAQTHYEDIEGDTLELVASVQNTDSADLFLGGFSHALRAIIKEHRQYKMLVVSSVGHNQRILREWTAYHSAVLETPCALYLYNYVWTDSPRDSEKWLMIL